MQNENPNKNSLIEEIKNSHLLPPEKIKNMIDKGANPNERDDEGNTPLILLAQIHGCDLELPKALLDNGADVNKKNNHGDTALSVALERYNLNLAKLLLEHKASVDGENLGEWIILKALTNKLPDLAELLVRNAPTDVSDMARGLLLAIAKSMKNKYPNLAKLIIEKYDKKKDEQALPPESNTRNTPLVQEVRNNKEEFADVPSEKDCANLELLFSAIDGNEDSAKQALESGADVDMNRADGDTPLMWAAMHGNLAVVKLLIGHGAKVNLINKKKETALDLAEVNGHTAVAEFLREHGAKRGCDL